MDAFLTNLPFVNFETKSQEPQRSSPTVTPSIKTPPPQETGKQADLQGQPLQPSVFVTNQPRPASQAYYHAGAGQQAPKILEYRVPGWGCGGTQDMGIQRVGGGGGQPTAIDPHHGTLPVPPSSMYMQSQMPLHTSHADHNTNTVFSCPPQRKQGHQNQSVYPSFQRTIVPNIFGYPPGPTTQHGGYNYSPQMLPHDMGWAGAGAVTGGASHVGSPLATSQAGTVVPQGSIQQPSQQPQPMAPMPTQLVLTEVYSGHNGNGQNPAQSLGSCERQRRMKASMDIVDPRTGRNISGDIYDDEAAIQSGDFSNRATPQLQNRRTRNRDIIPRFAAARAAKYNTEGSKSGSPVPNSAPETPNSQNPLQVLSNLEIQTNPEIDNNSQCNTGPSTPIPIVDPTTGKDLNSDLYKDHDNQAALTPQKSESIFRDGISSYGSSNGLLSMEQIHEKLFSLMSNEKENSLENICGWISKNVGKRVRDPGFINVLMTAILEASIEQYNNAWQFRVYKFQHLQGLITRYIDAGIKMSELQCLIAIQEYIHQLDTSQRVILQILEKQLIESILSVDVSRASENNKALSPVTGRSAAMKALKSFFTALNEANGESSYE